jgi:hypothetical protein
MTQAHQKEDIALGQRLVSIFMPFATRRRQEMIDGNGRFVHYTSAANALQIISTKQMWMRNTTCMSDFSEVQHGFRTLNRFLTTKSNRVAFEQALNDCFPGLAAQAINLFNQWWNDIQFNTYITSISEHDETEDNHGRLSMWRAFARATPGIALVLRVPITPPTAAQSFHVLFSPVAYFTDPQVDAELNAVIESIRTNRDFLRTTDREQVLSSVFHMLLMAVVCLKHEGFCEEREWRVVYAPKRWPSSLIPAAVEVIQGVPQIVYKIPLKGPPPDDLAGLDIPHLIDRVIIGPSQYPWAMYQAFVNALTAAGVADAGSRVFVSGIPIRT